MTAFVMESEKDADISCDRWIVSSSSSHNAMSFSILATMRCCSAGGGSGKNKCSNLLLFKIGSVVTDAVFFIPF